MPPVGGSILCLRLSSVPQAFRPALDPLDQSSDSLVAMELGVGVLDYAAVPREVFGSDGISCALTLASCAVRLLVGPPRGCP